MVDVTDVTVEAKKHELTERWLKDSDGSIINYIVRHFLALYDAPARIPTRSALDSALDPILGDSKARRAVVDAVLGVFGASMEDRSPAEGEGDIVSRINDACVGHPHAKIPWPHRLLHDARAEIERLRADQLKYDTPAWEANERLNGTVEQLCTEATDYRARIATLEAELAAAQSPGTIRLGEGLTEAQEGWPAQIKLCEAEIFDEMRKAMERFVWEDTAQGFDYWRDVSINAERIADALRASAAPKAEAVTVHGFTITADPARRLVRIDVSDCGAFSPEAALAIADALRSAAGGL